MLNANEIIPTAALDQQDLISSIQKQPADRYFYQALYDSSCPATGDSFSGQSRGSIPTALILSYGASSSVP